MIQKKKGNCTNAECNRFDYLISKLCPYCYRNKQQAKQREKQKSKPRKLQLPIKQTNKNSKSNSDFYLLAWNSIPDPKRCEECSRRLWGFNPSFISHILARGAWNKIKYDLRNFNLLCLRCHTKWGEGDKESMRIYTKNKILMDQLIFEYYGRKE